MIVPVKRWTLLAMPRLRAAHNEAEETEPKAASRQRGPGVLESFERMLGAQTELMFRNLDR
ncbi:MAG TPA: hypothetical protein VGE01_04780 [Fimbriimonas sp.]